MEFYGFHERYLKELQENISGVQEAILSGNLSYDEYKSKTGQFRGLKVAQMRYQELLDNMENNDD